MNVLRVRNGSWSSRVFSSDRKISSTPALLKKVAPRPAPRTLKKSRISEFRPGGSHSEQRSRWPTRIFDEANRSGFLKISANAAAKILNSFEEQGSVSASQLCTDHNIEPNVLTVLARILLRGGREGTARNLLFASARLGDDEAILLVIKEAIRLGGLYSPSVAMIYQQRFRPMLQKKHPAALFLEGQKTEREGHYQRALDIYEEILSMHGADSLEAMDEVSAADIWKAVGRLRARNQDRNGAEAAISTAALQYEDPAALFQLAKTFNRPSTKKYEMYMLKAAASGEAEAAHQLGLLYFKQSQAKVSAVRGSSSDDHITSSNASSGSQSHKRGSQLAVDSVAAAEKRQQAQEWFSVGAESGNVGSQLYLAILLRVSGEVRDGLQWLTLAGNPENPNSKEFQAWNPAITYITKTWHNPDIDLAHIDIDSIQEAGVTKPRLRGIPTGG